MGLDFSKTTTAAAPAATVVPDTKDEIAVVEQYDIVADREKMNSELVNSDEVDRIVSTIEVNNLETIVTFGAEVAEEISKASDVVLNSMNMSQLDDTSEMLKTLAKIMDQFDIDEIRENPGLFGKLFGNMKKQLDKILAKYHTMGEEVDKIYVQLKGYESEIKQSNRKLNTMFEANVNYYHELVKYILAGEQACKEIEDYIAKRQQDMAATGDESIQFELTSLNQARGAEGNPWIFAQILHYFKTGEELPKPAFEEVTQMLLRHARMQLEFKGEYTGIREIRKHATWYTAGYRNSSKLRGRINEVETYEQLEALFQEVCGFMA